MLAGRVAPLPPELWHDVNTDAILPGAFMRVPEEELAEHAFAGLLPEFRAWLGDCAVLAAGRNFGCGSSREQAPKALIGCGIRLVCAESFASIFFRNALNLGLAVLPIPAPVDEPFTRGERVTADLERGTIVREDGTVLQGRALGAHLLQIVDAGGILPLIRNRQVAGG